MARWRVLLAVFSAAMLSSAQPGPPKLQLPGTVRPMSYSADLRLIPGQDRFSGSIDIDIDILQPVSTIWLDGKALVFHDATLRTGTDVAPVRVEPAANDFVAIVPPAPLAPGRAQLHLSYDGEVSRTLTDGAFQQQYGNDWYIFTKFEPVTARRVFPCFDEPSYKVPWTITLHVPNNLKAFSNAPIASEQDEAGGMKAVRFQTTKPLPSYLIAFAAGPFDVLPTDPVGLNRTPSRIIVPRGRSAEAAYAVSITPKLIDMLEHYFGTPYPYPKLDQIVVPLTTAWGAMENAGLIAYGDFLLSPKQQDSELRRRSRALTMEHEMSHQWFGDLVTMAWWDDIWLNEAFASWLAGKLVNEWKPEWQIRADSARSGAVMRADSLTTARKIRQPIEAPGDIANAFDGITYGKGSAVIGMFENYVGPEKFQRAIRLYLRQHAGGNATSADLFSALDTVAGGGTGAAFSTFLDQVGFPLIDVAVRCDGGEPSLHVQQQRFVPVGSQARNDATWRVPVCSVWSAGNSAGRECFLLRDPSADFRLRSAAGCPDWLYADANAAGYYAVTYDPALQDKLAARGIPELKPWETAAALRNVQVLFSAGLGHPDQELRFAAGFSRSSDAGLVRQSAIMLAGIAALVPADLQSNYARRIRSLYGGRARALGWKPAAGEAEERRELRTDIVPLIATEGQDGELASQAVALAHAWLKDRHGLDQDMIEPVLFTAAWNGDRAFFELLVQAAMNTPVRRERDLILSALVGFRDPATARAALDLIFDHDLDPRELQSLPFSGRRETRETRWDFVRQNFDRLNARLPGARGIPFGASLPFAAAGFCDTAHAEEVRDFFEPRISSLPGGARNLANTLESIRLCAARAVVVRPAVAAFLSSP